MVNQKNERAEELISRACDKEGYMSSDQRYQVGFKRFKIKVLGRFGFQTTKTLEEMAQILLDLNIVQSLEEGRESTSQLEGTKLWNKGLLAQFDLSYDAIVIDTVRDGLGETKYKVSLGNYGV
ncbi:hypothetical protein J4438_03000 [Candidatus Woesearchaeota archaeon]|nr:hypothetical protein [Candidatus Woesearchaeota archaeon]